MNHGFVSWSDEKTDVKTVYTVEYITNKKDMEKLERHSEPWKLYQVKRFDNISEAMDFYILHRYMDALDIKITEELFVNGDSVREAYIELSPSLYDNISKCISKTENERRENAENQAKTLEETLRIYEEFMNKMPAQIKELYKQFVNGKIAE